MNQQNEISLITKEAAGMKTWLREKLSPTRWIGEGLIGDYKQKMEILRYVDDRIYELTKNLSNTFSEDHFDAIKDASEAGYQTVIINGLSNEWKIVKSACIGKGQATWLKPKGARQALRLAMLKSRVNIIAIYDLKSISDFPKEAQVKINNEILLKMGVAFEMEKVDFASFPVMIVRNGTEHFVIRDESGKLAKSFQLTSELFKGM